MNPEIIGWVAVALTEAWYAPQIWKALRTRSTADLSLPAFSLLQASLVSWLAYAIMVGAVPLAVCESIEVVQNAILLTLAARYRRA